MRAAATSPAAGAPGADLIFRELTSVDDIRLVQDLERQIWAYGDIDLSPMPLLIALVKAGALLIGACRGSTLEGFALSVPGDRHGHRLHWSHMMGIRDARRSSGLGTRLKFEQARRVAARGYTRIQWTYDPLQSLNAHLNLVKVGARACEYAEHVYGDSTSTLHRGAPTDRFIVTWDLRVDGVPIGSPLLTDLHKSDGTAAGTVTSDDEGWDVYRPDPALPEARVVVVPVPARFSAMLQEHPTLATAWRMQTRAQFQALFAAGYEAVSFRRSGPRGAYVLVRP